MVAQTHEQSAHAGFLTRLAGYLNAGSFVVLSALLIFEYTSHTPLSYLASGLGPKDKADLKHVAGLLMQHQTIVLIWAGICGIGGILSILAVRKEAWGRFICCAEVNGRVSDERSDSFDGFHEVQLQTLHAEGGRHCKGCAFVLLQFRRLFSNVLRRTAYPSFRRTSPIALLSPHLAKRVGEY